MYSVFDPYNCLVTYGLWFLLYNISVQENRINSVSYGGKVTLKDVPLSHRLKVLKIYLTAIEELSY